MATPTAARPTHRFQRHIGHYSTGVEGPTLVCVGGIHGNEPAGVFALERVFQVLHEARPAFRGRLTGLAGNLRALRAGSRFTDEDLNRAWSEERVRSLRSSPPEDADGEEQELIELDHCLEDAFTETAPGQTPYFLDLHTTSSSSRPFSAIGDTLPNRTFARAFPVPMILGLEEQIDGSIDEYEGRKGRVTVAFEAGQHDDPASTDLHEAAIWIGLVASGCLEEGALPQVARARKILEEASHGLPRALEIRYRRAVVPGDGFRMKEGFRNFQKIRAGDLLAHDAEGPVTAPESGRIFMPLYQSQGSDGFFVARPIPGIWLRVSRVLRRLRADKVVHWLPGVSRHPERDDSLVVDPRIARWFATEIFHLLGFRKERPADRKLIVSRRAHDRE